MVLDRLKQVAAHVTGKTGPPHPLDPLSETEIERAVAVIRKEHTGLFFNAVTLLEPRKAEMMAFVSDPEHSPRPRRVADIVCVAKGSKVFDGHVDLEEDKIIRWELTEGVQPLVSCFLLLIVLLLRPD
jgi:primary-amine oxidase